MDLIKDILSVIPPLTFSSHKGSAGRIGVIGGCKEYTGAPYFAAISALKIGCDLAHVFCTQDAASVIKSYSPELIVHPILDSENVQEEFSEYLPRLHSLVIGPGLGRKNFEATKSLIEMAKRNEIPLVFDADALFYVKDCPEIVSGYGKAILTPNKVEFIRLYESLCQNPLPEKATQSNVKELCNALGNVTIVHKGPEDIISDGVNTVICKEPGSPRRCGGQGDLLSGSMGVFNFWAHNFSKSTSKNLTYSSTIVAALAACMLTRKCNNLAFRKYNRSTLTTDMIVEIRTAFSSIFPVD